MDRRDLDDGVTVVVVDDHEIARRGLAGLFAESATPIRVVASGPDVDTAFAVIAARTADVVVLDLDLGGRGDRYTPLERLIDAGRRVVVYTHVAHDAVAVRCTNAGASAYVTKAEAAEHLVDAVLAAASGRPYTPPTLGGALAGDTDPRRPALSERETAALRAWFACRSKALAAEAMGVAPSTIQTFIERARTKYANHGRPAATKAEMVQRAIEDGILEVDL